MARSLEEWTSYLDERQKNPETLWILIFDAVNENPSFHELLEKINEFAFYYQRYSWIKIIVSVREVMFKVFNESSHTSRLYEGIFYKFHLPNGESSIEVPLERMTSNEVKDAYEKYLQTNCFSPKTPFEILPGQIKKLITHPWFLRLLVEGYHGKYIPAGTSETDIIHQYISSKIFGRKNVRKRKFLSKLSEIMYQSKTNLLSFQQLEAHKFIRCEIENFEKDSSYVQLLDDGILTEINKEIRPYLYEDYVRFTFDKMYDFSIANIFLEQIKSELSVEDIFSYIDNCIRHNALRGSAEYLVESLIDKSDSNFPNLFICSEEIFEPIKRILIAIFFRWAEIKPKQLLSLYSKNMISSDGKSRFLDLASELFRKGFNSNLYQFFHELSPVISNQLYINDKRVAEIFFWEGQMYQEQSQFSLARACMEKCLSKIDDPVWRNDALSVIGMTHRYEQNMRRARDVFDEVNTFVSSLDINKGNAEFLSRYYYEEGYWHRLAGNYKESISFLDKGVECAQKWHLPLPQSANLCFRGVVLFDLGRLREAKESLHSCLSIAEEIHSQLWIANAYFHLGEVAVVENDLQFADRCFKIRIDFFEKIEDPIGIFWTRAYQAWLRFLDTGDIKGITNSYDQALEEFDAIKYFEGSITFTNRAVWMFCLTKDLKQAEHWLKLSNSFLKKTTYRREEYLYEILCAWYKMLSGKKISQSGRARIVNFRNRLESTLFDNLLQGIEIPYENKTRLDFIVS